MQRLKDYLTREGWKRDLDETVEDILKVYRFITQETPEETNAKRTAKFFERILVEPTNLPKGVIHSLDRLKSYCDMEGIALVPLRSENKDEIRVKARLGKGLYNLTYDRHGNYTGMDIRFWVETDGQPLVM